MCYRICCLKVGHGLSRASVFSPGTCRPRPPPAMSPCGLLNEFESSVKLKISLTSYSLVCLPRGRLHVLSSLWQHWLATAGHCGSLKSELHSLLSHVSARVCVCVCMHVRAGDGGSPEPVVTSAFEVPGLSTGNQTGLFKSCPFS